MRPSPAAAGANSRLEPRDEALLDLLGQLDAAAYDFVTPTPETVRTITARRIRARPGNLTDIFGWGLPFQTSDLPGRLLDALTASGEFDQTRQSCTSRVKVARLDGRLFLHSARASEENAVFLGPDSYRFVRFLHEVLTDAAEVATALDVGVGAGAGAITLAALRPAAKVTGGDPNLRALRFLRLNALHAGVKVTPIEGKGVPSDDQSYDLIIANPPFIAKGERLYRDGGGDLGAALSLAWARQAAGCLKPGGRFVLYTGSAIVGGHDAVKRGMAAISREFGLTLTYGEIDPDIFGELLSTPPYAKVDRIAAVGAVLRRN